MRGYRPGRRPVPVDRDCGCRSRRIAPVARRGLAGHPGAARHRPGLAGFHPGGGGPAAPGLAGCRTGRIAPLAGTAAGAKPVQPRSPPSFPRRRPQPAPGRRHFRGDVAGGGASSMTWPAPRLHRRRHPRRSLAMVPACPGTGHFPRSFRQASAPRPRMQGDRSWLSLLVSGSPAWRLAAVAGDEGGTGTLRLPARWWYQGLPGRSIAPLGRDPDRDCRPKNCTPAHADAWSIQSVRRNGGKTPSPYRNATRHPDHRA